MRIFIGLTEIANVAINYAKGFQALGHETYTLVRQRNLFYPDAQYNCVIDEVIGVERPCSELSASQKITRYIKQKVFIKTQLLPRLMTNDIFIFLFGDSFWPAYRDYPLLKMCGKQIVSVFLGSDIRYGPAFEQEMRSLSLDHEIRPFIDYLNSLPGESFVARSKIVRAAERYADLILSQPGHGQLQSRPYMRVNIPLDLSQFHCKVPNREVPLILHAPSRPAIKGTDRVLAAIEQLKQENIPFEFRLIEKMPNPEVRTLLTEADIVIDELFSDTVATLSAEAMFSGNAVLVRYLPEYTKVPPGCPAINVNQYTLVDKLREVILNRELRRQLAYAGPPYVEANNDHVKIAQQILDWLKPNGIQTYDFTPSFFKDLVISSELLKKERQERWKLYRNKLAANLFR